MRTFGTALFAIAAILLAAVLVSLIPSDFWLIRTVDLVREPMAYLTTALLLVALFVRSGWRPATVVMLALVIAINVWRIWPYSALAKTDITLVQDVAGEGACFTAMSANVKVENENYAAIGEQIRRLNPDLLFLMETDREWIDALGSVLSRYQHVQRHPQPKGFGLVFASRLPVMKSRVIENTYRDTPTLYATVQPRGSAPVEFIGLHPKPPLPGWNTQERDNNIVNAGVQTPDRLPNAFVMGDFNDVPWSRTTTRFRIEGNWRDPRIGRGTYPTFPAGLLIVGWPLDQLMLKGELDLLSFDVLPKNSSDHRAVFGKICSVSR